MAKKNGNRKIGKMDTGNNTAIMTWSPEQKAELAKLGFGAENNFAGGAMPRLPQILIIHKAQIFDDAVDKVETITGVIIHYQRVNAWWSKSYDESGGGTPPNCASATAFAPTQGDSPQEQRCRDCEHNKFNPDGSGKACKNLLRVHVFRDGDRVPSRIVLPPSSLKSFENYVTQLTNKDVDYRLVRTRISLVKAKNKSGIEYSETRFEMIEPITDMHIIAEMVKNKKALDELFIDDVRGDEYGEQSGKQAEQSAEGEPF